MCIFVCLNVVFRRFLPVNVHLKGSGYESGMHIILFVRNCLRCCMLSIACWYVYMHLFHYASACIHVYMKTCIHVRMYT